MAIDHVDLQLQPGTITGMIGPNGAGKSTLIGLIGGAIAASEGSIRLDGRDISRLPASERARAGIGRTYQIPRPFLDMTVEENLEVAQYSIQPFIRAAEAQDERAALLDRPVSPMLQISRRMLCPCFGASGWRLPARWRCGLASYC